MNIVNISHTSDAKVAESPGLLFEMARSFTVLAETLNLSHAVKQLNSTRQTVRRHITHLEEAMGQPLFEVEDRQYQLTDYGMAALGPAKKIIAQGNAWLRGEFDEVDGLVRLSFTSADGWEYYQQHQPVSGLWQAGSQLLRTAAQVWAQGEGALESAAFSKIRDYILVYREIGSDWICTEIGEKSFYSNWFGWSNARSSVGRKLEDLPGGPEAALLMSAAYRQVRIEQGLRLDHVVTQVPKEGSLDLQIVVFERLLMACTLPDGSFALVAVVDRPDTLNISGLDPATLNAMPEGAKVRFVA